MTEEPCTVPLVYRRVPLPPKHACKFLIVRFGLYPLLYQPVTAISTGEIRKVLLARALSTRPSLLVLDNAFDGLDAPSRTALKELITTTLKGFSQLLVQGIDASATARAQVLLITHRAEEIVDEICTISLLPTNGPSSGSSGTLLTEARNGRLATDLLRAAMGHGPGANKDGDAGTTGLNVTNQSADSSSERARFGEILALYGGLERMAAPLVEARALRVCRDEAVLLHGLDWRVRQGEHWLIAGGNGAGKSTLSKLLALADALEQGAEGSLSVLGTTMGMSIGTVTGEESGGRLAEGVRGKRELGELGGRTEIDLKSKGDSDGLSGREPQHVPRRKGVGWVSTELHLSVAKSPTRAWDVVSGGRADDSAAEALAGALGLELASLHRPFCHLSQGEQKLVLIAAAIAKQPALLVLDEPCQGLDLISRSCVLSLVNSVCSNSRTTLVYITHHYEEVLPCVTHVLHFQNGITRFNGERLAYEASDFLSKR